MWFRDKFRLVGIVLFFLLAVMPLLLGVGYALLYSLGVTGILSEGLTLEHWSEVLSDAEILFSFGYSVYITTTTMGIAVMASLFITLQLGGRLNRGALSYISYFPLAIPAIVAALFIFQLFSKAGLFSRISYQVGFTEAIQSFPGLVNDRWAIGIIAAHVMLAVPFFVIYFRNIYRSENLDRYRELALSLGSYPLQTAFRVQVPVLLYRALPTIVLYFLFVLGSYEIPLILGQESPQMVSVLAIRKLRKFNLMDIPEAYIIAILYLIVILGLVLLLFRKRRLSYDL